jgi:hypothetical protein
MSVAKAPGKTDRNERARNLAHILTVTLDKIPGLREALPRLKQLEEALRERGMVALNDAPLPGVEQIRSQISRLAPQDNPEMINARALLLGSLDRRAKARRSNGPTIVDRDGVFAGEATLSEFMEELEGNPPN